MVVHDFLERLEVTIWILHFPAEQFHRVIILLLYFFVKRHILLLNVIKLRVKDSVKFIDRLFWIGLNLAFCFLKWVGFRLTLACHKGLKLRIRYGSFSVLHLAPVTALFTLFTPTKNHCVLVKPMVVCINHRIFHRLRVWKLADRFFNLLHVLGFDFVQQFTLCWLLFHFILFI